MLLCQAPSPSKQSVSLRCPGVLRWMLSPAGGGVPRGNTGRQEGVGAVDQQGATPLHMACASAVRALAALAQASSKSPAARAAETAAASASALVLLLLQASADPNQRDARGNTPRSLADAGPKLPPSARLRLGDGADGAEDVLAAILGLDRNRAADGPADSGAGGAAAEGGTPALLDDGSSRDGASTIGSGGGVSRRRSGGAGSAAAVGVPGPAELMRQAAMAPGPPLAPQLRREDGDAAAGGDGSGGPASSTSFAVSPGTIELQWEPPAPLGPACPRVSGYELQWRTVGRVLRSAGSRASAPQFALRPERPSEWTTGGAPLGAAGAAWAMAAAAEDGARPRSGSQSPGAGMGAQEDEDTMRSAVSPEQLAACMAKLGPLANGQAYQIRLRAIDEQGGRGEWTAHEAPPQMTVLAGGSGGTSYSGMPGQAAGGAQ